MNNNIELVQLLLEYQADPNFREASTQTSPLFVAIDNGYDEVASLLQKYHANTEEALFCGLITHLQRIVKDEARLDFLNHFLKKVNMVCYDNWR